jgi:hypothetical protein
MTVIRSPSPLGYTVFCDDIRQEIGGKLTLVGVYSGEMTVFGTLPATLPKLALYIRYMERVGESNEPLELRIYKPGDPYDSPTLRVPISEQMLEKFRSMNNPPDELDDPLAVLSLHLAVQPIEFRQEGVLRVRMIRGENEIKLGGLRIKAQPKA